MLEQFGTKEIAGEVIAIAVYHNNVFCGKPAQVALEAHADSHTVAMAAGDTNGALLNSIMYAPALLWAGMKLDTVKREYDNCYRFLKKYKHNTWLAHIIQTRKWFKHLMGLDEYELKLSEAAQEVQTNPHLNMTYYFQSMFL